MFHAVIFFFSLIGKRNTLKEYQYKKNKCLYDTYIEIDQNQSGVFV